MRTLSELLNDLHERGYTLRTEAGTLYLAPATGLTVADRDDIRRLKPEILACLALASVDGPRLPVLPDDDVAWDDPRTMDGVAYQRFWAALRGMEERRQ